VLEVDMAHQLDFVEAFLSETAGRNRRLDKIAALFDWAPFAALLGAGEAAGPGRPCYAPLAMFRAMLLAQWYQLSDPALEEALADRISFRHFCGFSLTDATPDETTLCRFRNGLARRGVSELLMAELERQLGARGLLIKDGTMIDATLIAAQAKRPRDDYINNAPAEAGRTDRDAAFGKKERRTIYGYKAHVAVDVGSGLIRRALLTPANVHDTCPADALVMGDERAVYADKAYATHARRAWLRARGIKDRIMHCAHKHRPLRARQLQHNMLISRTRAAVERTFGTWKRCYGYSRVRYFTLIANACELQLKAIAFNMRRAAVLAA
jgi:IS5 family transposase